MTKKKLGVVPALIISYAAVLALWAVFRLWAEPLLGEALGAESLIAALIECLTKSLLLITPAIFLVRIYREDVLSPPREIWGCNVRCVYWGLGAAALLILYLVIRRTEITPFKLPGINLSELKLDYLLTTVLFAGLTEEIFFRGWILNALVKKMDFLYANIITSFVFLLLHYPYWFAQGNLSSFQEIFSLSLPTFCIGFVLGYAAHKSRAVWGAVFAHCVYNLGVAIIK